MKLRYIFLLIVELGCYQIQAASMSSVLRHAVNEGLRKLDQLYEQWFYSARYGELETIKKIATKVNINAQNQYGATALIQATIGNREDIVKFLLTVPGIDVNVYEKNRQTALNIAARDGHKNIVALLLTFRDINVNCKGFGSTPLIEAADSIKEDHYEIVKLLLRAPGIDVNCQGYDRQTAIMCAVKLRSIRTIEELLKKPEIDLNIRDNQGMTALLHAPDKELFMMLVESGKEIQFDIIDKNGNSARTIADKIGASEVLDIKIYNLKVQAFECYKSKDKKKLKSIIDQIGSDEIVDLNGVTLLDHAFAENNAEIACYLLSHSADPRGFLARYPLEFVQPTSDLFKLCVNLAYVNICAHCSKHNCQKKCSRCKKVYYCSEKCQKAHWTKHKTECKRTN